MPHGTVLALLAGVIALNHGWSFVQTWFNHEQKNSNARRSDYAYNDQNLGQNLAHDLP
jgi:hypothetical protein